MKVRVAAEAIGLARAGGIFVPASSILRLREVIHAASGSARPLSAMFTTREAGVVEALRQGKPNKIIAYELNLCESTVKVHIRNIMKKLKATNRTEMAYKLRQMVCEGYRRGFRDARQRAFEARETRPRNPVNGRGRSPQLGGSVPDFARSSLATASTSRKARRYWPHNLVGDDAHGLVL